MPRKTTWRSTWAAASGSCFNEAAARCHGKLALREINDEIATLLQ